MSKLVNRAVNDRNDGRRKLVLSKEIPIKVWVYERTGAGMDWHVDDILFSPEQVEVIFTVENTPRIASPSGKERAAEVMTFEDTIWWRWRRPPTPPFS